MPSLPFIEKLYGLLAPPSQQCLSCSRQTRHSSPAFPELCQDCAGGIPWIYKPRCPICGRGMGCPDCTRGDWAANRSFVMNRSAVRYDERMREWLGQYKYRGRESLAPLLGEMMIQAYKGMEQELREMQQDRSWRVDAVTCVPVSPSRLLERGFNQAEVLAESVARTSGRPLLKLLQRSRDTEKQSLKSRSERLHDMRKVFIPIPGALQQLELGLGSPMQERPLRLLLVDDIYTTGSTIGACAGQLQALAHSLGRSAEIYSLTWARS